MINKGDLFQGRHWRSDVGSPLLVEVVRTYDKRDIDYDCPESVAIIGMVEAIVLTGPDIGKTKRYRRSHFHGVFKRVEEAS